MMVDNEKRENLANARRQLKKFRDQNQGNISETNGNDVNIIDTASIDSSANYSNASQLARDLIRHPHSDGTQKNASKSSVTLSEEKNRQRASLVENQNQNQQRSRIEIQQLSTGTNSTSGRTSLNAIDSEEKMRRDIKQLQEQLEIHVQTIGMLVAEKSDVSAKLSQSFKQLERKQSEMDELHGRLKASREHVQELEKQILNSTSNVQKREMAAKEFDKENDRLKIENIRQSQSIEDLKQNINELNEKLHNRKTLIDQLNLQLEELKQSSQSTNETSVIEQQINEFKQNIQFKNSQIEELSSSINRMRSDNEQYQQYNTNMQNHILELDQQINQLTERNNFLQNENDNIKRTYEMKLSDQCLIPDHSNLQQENNLYRNAIDQWSNRYEELKARLEEMTRNLTEKDDIIIELKTNNKNIKHQSQSTELPEHLNQLSNENMNLKIQIEYLNEHIQRIQSKSTDEQQTQTDDRSIDLPLSSYSNNSNQIIQQDNHDQLNQTIRENIDLKARIENLEHVIQQLQSETETIGDYIHLYQQQREQLQKRYQEKDIYIQQLTYDRLSLEKKISEFEMLFIQAFNVPMGNVNQSQESNTHLINKQIHINPIVESESNTSTNQQAGSIENISSSSMTSDQIVSQHSMRNPTSRLPELSDETKLHILKLIKELQQTAISPVENHNSSRIKLAFVDSSIYSCPTCSGPVQSV